MPVMGGTSNCQDKIRAAAANTAQRSEPGRIMAGIIMVARHGQYYPAAGFRARDSAKNAGQKAGGKVCPAWAESCWMKGANRSR